MFKILGPKKLIFAVAWLTVLILTAVNSIAPFLSKYGITPKLGTVVLIVQLLVTAIVVTPAWRFIWRKFPSLNWLVFPDLNGEWDVEGLTNWPRIDATLKAANREIGPIDMRRADESALPPLGSTLMRARIKQTWHDITIMLWNPTGQGPIKASRTLSVEPFAGKDGRHGLVYVFEQENATTVVSDERTFLGAAKITLEPDNLDMLCGQMWSDRMWRRGMNTAAEIRFRRRSA